MALTSSSWKRGGDVRGLDMLREISHKYRQRNCTSIYYQSDIQKRFLKHYVSINNVEITVTAGGRTPGYTWTAHATFVLFFSFSSFATEISGFYDAYPQTPCTLVKRQRYIDFSGRKIWKYLKKKGNTRWSCHFDTEPCSLYVKVKNVFKSSFIFETPWPRWCRIE